MDIIAAYGEAGTYRGAAEIAGTTHKTVRRVMARHEAGGAAPERAPRGHNYDNVTALVAERVTNLLRWLLRTGHLARKQQSSPFHRAFTSSSLLSRAHTRTEPWLA